MRADSRRLLVLLRGVAFREGSRWIWNSGPGPEAVADQSAALQSIRSFALAPAHEAGWRGCDVAIDVVLHGEDARLRQAWHQAVTAHLQLTPVRSRISEKHQGTAQIASVLSSLAWLSAGENLLTNAGGLLLLRADVLLKQSLRVPQPNADEGATQFIRVPFDMMECTKGHLLVDTIVFVPATQYEPFERFLLRRPKAGDLHWIHHGTGVWLETWLPHFHGDPNTAVNWNPMYEIIGRPRATKEEREQRLAREPWLYRCNESSLAFRQARNYVRLRAPRLNLSWLLED